jgi:hypothetical protein
MTEKARHELPAAQGEEAICATGFLYQESDVIAVDDSAPSGLVTTHEESIWRWTDWMFVNLAS